MKSIIVVLSLITICQSAFADWGVTVGGEDGKKVKIGGRLQGVMTQVNDGDEQTEDFYLRRTRINVEYKPLPDQKLYFDVRSDKVNKDDDGEGGFTLGDAYWQYSFKNYPSIHNVKLFRGKVDVSYSQTTSSKNLLQPTRATISDHASNYISHNRRANNAQINGSFGSRVYYHLVIGDGIHSSKLKDIGGTAVTSIDNQKFMTGGKIRLFALGDAKTFKNKDTQYGPKKEVFLGLGHFTIPKIKYTSSAGTEEEFSRSLTNIELVASFDRVRFIAESYDFQGELETESDGETDSSNGHTASLEVYLDKNYQWAAYIQAESWNKWNSEDDYVFAKNGIGVNRYFHNDLLRVGAVYEVTAENEDLGIDEDETQMSLYMMMNF